VIDARSATPLSVTRGDTIEVRGYDLAADLIGNVSFAEMMLLDLTGERPSPAHVRVVDAVLVAMMEHGITPSTLAARLVLDGAPESAQGAVAAGLLAGGSRFLGVIDEAGALLQEVVRAAGTDAPDAAARSAVERLVTGNKPIPGLGHNLHAPEDPRVRALIELAQREGAAGPHVAALDPLQAAARELVGHPLIINAAGAVAAILSDLGFPPEEMRGFALVARCAGLVAHVADERRRPIARDVWQRAHEDA
jgi:citrate synthase